jgi:ABC-2 type transport system permease protein
MGAVIRKEFRQIVRDPRTLAVIIALPLFLLVMFGYAISLDVENAPIAVVDYDKSSASRALTETFRHNEYTALARTVESARAVEALMRSETVQAAVIIPRDFSSALHGGEQAAVQVLVDGTNGSTASSLQGYLRAIVLDYGEQFRREHLSGGAGSAGGGGSGIDGSGGRGAGAGPGTDAHAATGGAAGTAAGGPEPLIDFRQRVWFNPELESNRFLIPGLVAFLLVVTAVISTALSVVREKEQGTMEQLVASPLSQLDLILGKSIPYMAISLLVAAFIFGSSYLVFGVGIAGSVVWLAVVTVLFLFACLAFGIFISSIAETQQVAFMVAVLTTLLPSFLLSGFVFPIENMPVPIQAFTYIVPARYYLSALRAVMLKGAGPAVFWADAALLMLFAVVMTTAGSIRLGRGGISK